MIASASDGLPSPLATVGAAHAAMGAQPALGGPRPSSSRPYPAAVPAAAQVIETARATYPLGAAGRG
jgi:hypothetical protein